MMCDRCKERPACVHIAKVINNHKTEQHLCEVCAKETGEFAFSYENAFSVHDFLKGMFSSGMVQHPPSQETRCSSCGMSYSDFSRDGKFGCSECYKAFGNQITPLIRRIHGTRGHTGKVPKRAGGMLAIKQRLSKLRQELKQLVALEEYEKAAAVRDQIKQLESELTHGQAPQ